MRTISTVTSIPMSRRGLLAGMTGLLTLGRPPARARTAGPVLTAAVSTPIFADIVAAVGGERVAAYSVIPVGADPHTWEASPGDIVRAAESDTFISMGAHLEPFVEPGAWRRAIQEAGIPTLELAGHVDLIAVDRVIDHGDHVHDLREGDPHVWLDPTRTIQVVDAVQAHLATLDPAGAATYAANADAYRSELRALDDELTTAFATIPAERRKLVVFHDAFTYFARRYDFAVVGVVLKSPSDEPSARDLAELIAAIEAEDVPVIFTEPQFDRAVVDTIAEEAGVHVGEILTDTFALGVETYLGLMRFNRDSLVTNLTAE